MTRWWKKVSLYVGAFSLMLGSGLSMQVRAQDGALTELYGYGVHRYYAGDYNEAQRVFNIVIEAGVEDPRPHYFRGLTQYQMGMTDAGKADFEHAADLEARGKRVVNIGLALQRIQGPARQEIEMARLMARVAVEQERLANKQAQADQSRTAPQIPTPPAGNASALPPALSGDVPAVPVQPGAPGTPDTQTDPFRDDASVPAPVAPMTPATPAPTTPAPAGDDPFGSSAAPATPAPTTPAPAADPFGTPATPAAPAPTTPAPAADPFSAPATPAAPAPAADPFGSN